MGIIKIIFILLFLSRMGGRVTDRVISWILAQQATRYTEMQF